MFTNLLGFIMKSKGFKIGGGLLGGGSVIALATTLYGSLNTKFITQEANQKEYVQLVIAPIYTEITHLKKEASETKKNG